MADTNIKDMDARTISLNTEWGDVVVTTYRSLQRWDESMYLCQMHARGVEISTEGKTRGEAMLELSKFLKETGYALARAAFEHEGAVEIPKAKR